MNNKGVVLNSRQQLRPSLINSWVKETIRAVEYCQKNKLRLISSVGMSSWELATALGRFYDLPMILYVYGNDQSELDKLIEYYRSQFDLINYPVEFQLILADSESELKELPKKRDRLVLNEADILIPVSLRENGRMLKLIKIHSGKKIVGDFKSEYSTRTENLSYTINRSELNDKILSLENKYLIHWTKSSNTAWPTERLLDYYLALANKNNYPRSAYDSLKNIIKNKTICASSKNIVNNTKVVSFSNQTVEEMLPLFRWRARHKQMSFEPYGIGIKKEVGRNIGIKPVKYYNLNNPVDIADNHCSWEYQSEGRISSWKKEMEYRCPGDFKFKDISTDDLILITRYKKEAEQINKMFGLKTISLTNK